jgi:hypothetical protein
MMIILNALFVVIFWNMSDVAKEEDRPGWSFIYLFASAASGAAIAASIF